uniref:BTB domain-containing protein n=1 Tax=Panagrolaimus davidi TaxID=227884 RepID=A0A914PG01_9BILA
MSDNCEHCDERFKMFQSQNQETGFFDVTFDIEGKLIHAHKFMLASVSEVLKRMVSDTWNNGDPITIKAYSFKDFYEFLKFIYSGKCSFTDENIFAIVDLSEFYQVKSLQHKCDQFLSKKEYTAKNVLVILKALSNYSLPLFEKSLCKAVKENGINLVESDGFTETSKESVMKIVKFKYKIVSEENLFEKIYEWAENQAQRKKEQSNEKIFNMNDAIKSELTEILPYIQFKNMNLKFLNRFVVKKGFLFSYNELSEILDFVCSRVTVKVINSKSQHVSGMLQNDSAIVANINSLKNVRSFSFVKTAWWGTNFKVPSTRSSLKKRDGVDWYLFYYRSGELGMAHCTKIHNDYYLLAEMTPGTSGFDTTEECKIETE